MREGTKAVAESGSIDQESYDSNGQRRLGLWPNWLWEFCKRSSFEKERDASRKRVGDIAKSGEGARQSSQEQVRNGNGKAENGIDEQDEADEETYNMLDHDEDAAHGAGTGDKAQHRAWKKKKKKKLRTLCAILRVRHYDANKLFLHLQMYWWNGAGQTSNSVCTFTDLPWSCLLTDADLIYSLAAMK